MTANANTPFGCRWSGAPEYDTFGAIIGSTGQLTIYYGRYSDAKYIAYMSYDKSVVHDIEINENNIVYDGATQSITRGSFNSTQNLYIGAFNNQGEATNQIIGKIYAVEIKESGNIVANFVPARRESDGVLGMYDLANGQFYTNAGTGTFTAGPVVLPAGYTALEYLTSGTGGQYIDTGILFDPTKNFRVVGSLIYPSATLRKVVLGNYYSTQAETYYSIELYSDGKFRNYMSADGGTAFNIYSPTAVHADTIAYFDTSYNALAHQTTTTLRYVTTEQTYSGATPETTNVAVHTLKLFNDKRSLSPVYNNPVSIGAVQIYIDGVLEHNYVPAQQGNTVGMYDTVNGHFYTDANGGNFTAGPVAQ